MNVKNTALALVLAAFVAAPAFAAEPMTQATDKTAPAAAAKAPVMKKGFHARKHHFKKKEDAQKDGVAK